MENINDKSKNYIITYQRNRLVFYINGQLTEQQKKQLAHDAWQYSERIRSGA